MQNNTFSRLSLRQNLIVLEQTPSTNDYLKEYLSNTTPRAEGTAIMANHQTQGKGQRGTTWLSAPGENLTISFVLYPNQLNPLEAFNLNMLVSLGIHAWASQLVGHVKIKWPNDIYVNNKKVGGVLIENQLSHGTIKSSIIGIGINLNQADFPIELRDKATSLRQESGLVYNIEETGLDLLESILTVYASINVKDTDLLLNRYNDLLFQKDQKAIYAIQEKEYTGIIQGVDHQGKLIVNLDNENQTFDLKEIKFVRPLL